MKCDPNPPTMHCRRTLAITRVLARDRRRLFCRDGKAWYLYYWQENDVTSTTMHQWGRAASPPGADQLGQNEYAGVIVEVRPSFNHTQTKLETNVLPGHNKLSPRRLQRHRLRLYPRHSRLMRARRHLQRVGESRFRRSSLGGYFHRAGVYPAAVWK